MFFCIVLDYYYFCIFFGIYNKFVKYLFLAIYGSPVKNLSISLNYIQTIQCNFNPMQVSFQQH
jgi:hypothetical protein